MKQLCPGILQKEYGILEKESVAWVMSLTFPLPGSPCGSFTGFLYFLQLLNSFRPGTSHLLVPLPSVRPLRSRDSVVITFLDLLSQWWLRNQTAAVTRMPLVGHHFQLSLPHSLMILCHIPHVAAYGSLQRSSVLTVTPRNSKPLNTGTFLFFATSSVLVSENTQQIWVNE